jgi:hypothetical protein
MSLHLAEIAACVGPGAHARAPALRRTQGDTLARDPRFAIGIDRAAALTGAMGSGRFKR